MSFDLHFCLHYLIEHGGSDLHLKVPSPPVVRVDGAMHPVDGLAPLTPEDTERAVTEMLGEPDKLHEFREDGEVDFAYSIPGLARFRCNAFRQRGSVSLVIRAIPVSIKTINELSLPPVIRELAEEERGIVLLTGTTGSGKSTTLAAMIDHINSTRRRHIVTVEDPLEFLHEDKKSIINQREVGMDTGSFKRALRRVLRQDPDVILIGEMRDEETVHTALSAAETGHLVFSTVHTVDAAETSAATPSASALGLAVIRAIPVVDQDRSTSSRCRPSSASWPRRSAGSCCSPAPPARASRRRSPR